MSTETISSINLNLIIISIIISDPKPVLRMLTGSFFRVNRFFYNVVIIIQKKQDLKSLGPCAFYLAMSK